jgi:ATP-binding cassette subfamily C (CFTR/MRP) protein 1
VSISELNLGLVLTETKAIKSGNPKLLPVLFKALKWHAVMPILPRLTQVAFTLCQPLLLRRLLNYLANRKDQESSSIGYGLIGAYAIVYIGMAVSAHRTNIFHRCKY